MIELEYQKSRRAAYYMALRILRSHEDAEDCVQRAAVRALETKSTFRGDSTWSSWFQRIVITQALMMLRERRSRRENLTENFDLELHDRQHGVTPETLAFVAERDEKIHRAVEGLPAMLRRAAKDILADKSVSEQRVGVNESTRKARIWRARHQLRTLLEPEIAA